MRDLGKRREYSRKYYAANAKKQCEKRRGYRAANLEMMRERDRKRYAANPERYRKTKGLPDATRPMPEFCERNCGRKATSLDHCHTTGIFRGWLCSRCNTGIGMLGDTLEDLCASVDYLMRAIP